MHLSAAAASMPRSGVREIMELAASLPDVIHLEVGEPDADTPPHVIEAAHQAALAGATRYAPNAGTTELRTAIAHRVSRRTGRATAFDQVIVTNGAAEGLFATMQVLFNPGEELLLPDPGWPGFRSMAALARVEMRSYDLRPERAYDLDLDEIAASCTLKTRGIVINTPSNPIGALLSEAALIGLVRLAEERDLWIIADECYDEIVFEAEHPQIAALSDSERLVVVRSFSKTYAMTGWRVGYVIAPEPVAALLAKAQEPILSCINSPAQAAALAALEGPQDFVADMVDSLRARRDAALELLSAHDVAAFRPDGALYLWIDVRPTGLSSRDFARRLVQEASVAVVPGSAFGDNGEGFIRVSIATAREQLLDGLTRLVREYRTASSAHSS